MPAFLDDRIPRRLFLGRTFKAVGALAAVQTLRLPATGPDDEAPIRLALLADTHIPADPTDAYRGFRPVENLETIVPEVIQYEPHGVIIDGDAARLAGELDDYHVLKRLIEPLTGVAPVSVALGNHDHRDHFLKVFEPAPGPRQPVAGQHVLVLEWPTTRLIVLDSLLYVNRTAGLLGRAQRAWLNEYLPACDNRPTILVVHHTLGDGDGDLLDADRMFQIIRPHPKVKAIFYGHSHRYDVTRDGALHLVNLPAVGYNFRDDQPVGWIEGRFTRAGVELTLRACGGHTGGDGKTTSILWS
jgi:3',5'-cyclic-AMP phosphodiesterase